VHDRDEGKIQSAAAQDDGRRQRQHKQWHESAEDGQNKIKRHQ
jgi:hypothetical protein